MVYPQPEQKKPEQKNLFAAARDGDLERVRADSAAGVDPNAPDPEGSTALCVAAGNAHARCASLVRTG